MFWVLGATWSTLSCECTGRLQSHAHDMSRDVNNRAERTIVTRVSANNCDCYKTDELLSENIISQFAMKGITVVIREPSLCIDCFDHFVTDLSLKENLFRYSSFKNIKAWKIGINLFLLIFFFFIFFSKNLLLHF